MQTFYYLYYDPVTGRGKQSGYQTGDTFLQQEVPNLNLVITQEYLVPPENYVVTDATTDPVTYVLDPWVPPKPDLDVYKAAKVRDTDNRAEVIRAGVATPGSGQAMSYLRKAEVAAKFLRGETLTVGEQMRITAEAERLGVTNEVAAQGIKDTAEAWERFDAHLDAVRLTTKKLINEAVDHDGVDTAYANADWPV